MSNIPIFYKVPISVKGTVFEDNSVWLRKNERDEWELPGGKIDFGEQPEETIVREIQEELGLKVEPIRLVMAHILTAQRFHDETDGVLVLIYQVKILEKTGDLELQGEAGKSEFKKFNVDEIGTLPIPSFYIEAIRKGRTLVEI